MHQQWRYRKSKEIAFGKKGCIEARKDTGSVLVIGYMNARVEDGEMGGIDGKFRVSGMKENGRKLLLK